MQRTEVYSIVSESCYSGKAPGIYHLLIKRWLASIIVWDDHFTVELKSGLKIEIEE